MRLPRPAFVIATVCAALAGTLLLPLPREDAVTPAGGDRRLVASLLDEVPTTQRRIHVLGYDRSHFGGWETGVTAEGALCTTRERVMLEIFDATVPADGGRTTCPRAGGSATDVYTGDLISPSEVEIDHVVPLAAAWDHGAYAWDRARRVAFANDLDRNLLGVSGQANQAKSDGTPAEWLPPLSGAAPCAYVARYLTVSVGYGLSVSEPDVSAARVACRL
ncbi:HNH endonuclease family protein [Corynebacterium variabile]|uniref:HNH endonuclease family protein n=2 Tax=Corynebacterium variabile TaxID=1727 RepID=UPI002647F63F|nr:HNH endonuclease family protein [Corynebacterium variabile]MDN6240105.1 HNH endonuclease family protein [Corynebacterium variabile]MDN6476696.1 HNH endonuclease family protein [Corynebacterium variabile]MDN6618346.1 HNH endonuclease family protein [Corynebacterium variabile]